MQPHPAPHAADLDALFRRLGSGRAGLAEREAAARLRTVGPNALRAAPPASALRVLASQLRSVVVLLLVVAAALSMVLGDLVDAAAIGAVLLLNTLLGFVTELRARRAMEALQRLEAPTAVVLRDGRAREVAAHGVVPGDVVLLEPGQAVPADARLLVAVDLQTNEAALTGESLPVTKHDQPVAADAPLPDRRDMVYLGSAVVAGEARALVVATGMATELGRIGTLAGALGEERTPLERRLDALGRRLALLALATSAVVVGLGASQGRPLGLLLETGLALAIAAVPEGLPAVATIALAVGVRRMARRRALVRRLPSVETLGSVTVVCTDKTGTLTAGELTVTDLVLDGRAIRVTGTGFDPTGEFLEDRRPVVPRGDPVLTAALRIAVLANRAEFRRADDGWTVRGDPTEVALLVAGRKAGLDADGLRAEWPEVGQVPFSSSRMLMATFHGGDDGLVACLKGAPGRVLDRCTRVLGPEGDRPLDEDGRERVVARNQDLAARGLRVLALATGRAATADERGLAGLTFVGLVAMADVIAPGVPETVAALRGAGIRTVMITGDQQRTAEAIGRELGLLGADAEVVDGRALAHLDDEALTARVPSVGGFSRVSPEDKLRIVAAFQRRGEILAMLGDGVNDAAALKKADVGVAMGRRGTAVAKEASDIVLQDDAFPTVAAAVEEGRVVFDNIRRFVFYLFSCNLAEILVLLGAGLLGLPLPLLPLQILWLNLVTDTFPALALAVEPAEERVMQRPPRDPKEAILSSAFLRSMALYAGLITVAVLAAVQVSLWTDPANLARAQTYGFMTLALAQLLHLGNARGERDVLAPSRALANRAALGAVAIVLLLQALAVHARPLASLLGTVALSATDWVVVVTLAAVPAIVGQVAKAIAGAR
jgi:Ca2+-transporting ATPase